MSGEQYSINEKGACKIQAPAAGYLICFLFLYLLSCKVENNTRTIHSNYECIETTDSILLCASYNKAKQEINFTFINKSSDSLYVPERKTYIYGYGKGKNDTITEIYISAYDGNSASVFPISLIIVPPKSIYSDRITFDKQFLRNELEPYSIRNYDLKIEYLRPELKYLITDLNGRIVIDNEQLFYKSDRIVLRNYIKQLDTINLSKEKRNRIMKKMSEGKL